MAIAFVSRANGGSVSATGIGSTGVQTHTAGNLLIAGCSCSQAPVTLNSVDDDAGNTWNPVAGASIDAAGNRVRIFYAYNCIGQVNNVVRVNTSAVLSYNVITVSEFSGALTTDPLIDADNGDGSGTAFSTVNALGAGDLIFAFMAASGNSLVAGTGFNLSAFAITGDATAYFGSEYKITTGSQVADGTCASSAWVVGAASFAAAGGGGVGTSLWWQDYVKQRIKAKWRNNGLLWTPSYAA